MTRTDVPVGDYQVTVEELTTDCAVAGPATRSIAVPSAGEARLEFEITCSFVAEERIVYNSFHSDDHTSDLLSVRPDGSGLRMLREAEPEQSYPAWSPDGSRILLRGLPSEADFQNHVMIVNHDGTEVTPIGRGDRPAWSPDGRRVAYEFGFDILVADLEGRAFRNVVNLTGDGRATSDGGPAWSPDGTQIAFHRDLVVHVVNADGSGLEALAPGAFPVWMPDGRRILFVDRTIGQIGSMRPDGTDVRILTNQEGGAGHPDPSPDGRKITFHSPSFSNDSRIWIMNADGSDPHVLEAVPAHAEHPDWGP